MKFLQPIGARGLLCAFLWGQAAQAADQVQTNAPNKSGDSAATTEMLIKAVRSAPLDTTNSVAPGASANQIGGSTNLARVVAANKLDPASITNAPALATNQSQTGTTNSAGVLDGKRKLKIGDRLSFRILEDEEGPRSLFVTDSGDLEVPYIGRVPAENKTCRQLAAEIKTSLEKEYYFQATVIIAVDLMATTSINKSLGRVYLVGAVRLPGPVELPSDEVLTLSRAVLRAGGFTDYADRRHVKVTRRDDPGKDTSGDNGISKDTPRKEDTSLEAVSTGAAGNQATTNNGKGKDDTGKDHKQTFIVDVGEIFDKGKIETDLTLEPGDLIFVPDRLIRF